MINFAILYIADINECVSANTCGDAARCVNVNGSYYCQCRVNYNSSAANLQDITRQTDAHCQGIMKIELIINIFSELLSYLMFKCIYLLNILVKAYTGIMTINRTYESQLNNSNSLQYQVLSFDTVQAVSYCKH